MNKLSKNFYCLECKRNYKSYQSLWNHNKKFHVKSEPKNNQNEHFLKNTEPKNNQNEHFNVINNQTDNTNFFHCKYCNKEYKYSQSKNRHQKKCENDLKIKNQILEKNINEMKNEFKKQLQTMKDEMMEIIKKSCKMHPKTLQKINNQLNNCNITNINIVQLGKEDIVNTLSQKEKIGILNNCYQSIEKLIEYVHFNPKYPQFKNIAITNLKDEYAYRYDEIENKFMACKKEELLEDLFDNRTIDLEEILDENTELITNVKASKIKTLLEKLYDKSTLYDKKKSNIKLLIYNKSEKDIINV